MLSNKLLLRNEYDYKNTLVQTREHYIALFYTANYCGALKRYVRNVLHRREYKNR